MTQPDQVSVPIRWTFKEARRIYGELCLLQRARHFREHPDPYAAVFTGYDGRLGFDYGRFDVELNRSLETAFAKIRSVSGTSKRLRMTAFEIAACMLGLRWTATRLRRGKFIPPGMKLGSLSAQVAMAKAGTWKRNRRQQVARVRPRYLAAVDRLMQKLENSRKRAKRAYLQAHGEDRYRETEERWKGHVRWVRVHLMEVGIRRWRAQQPGRKRLYRQRVQDWAAAAREALEADKLPPPSEDELVRVVKKALRSARRFQRTLSRRSLSIPERHDLLSEHVWNIIDRDCLSWVRSKARQDMYDTIYRAAGIAVLGDTDEEKPQGKERKPRGKKKKAKQPGRPDSAQALKEAENQTDGPAFQEAPTAFFQREIPPQGTEIRAKLAQARARLDSEKRQRGGAVSGTPLEVYSPSGKNPTPSIAR